MKWEKRGKKHSGEKKFVPELDKDLKDLVAKGYIEELNMNGEVVYTSTQQGDRLAKELSFDKSKNWVVPQIPYNSPN